MKQDTSSTLAFGKRLLAANKKYFMLTGLNIDFTRDFDFDEKEE